MKDFCVCYITIAEVCLELMFLNMETDHVVRFECFHLQLFSKSLNDCLQVSLLHSPRFDGSSTQDSTDYELELGVKSKQNICT